MKPSECYLWLCEKMLLVLGSHTTPLMGWVMNRFWGNMIHHCMQWKKCSQFVFSLDNWNSTKCVQLYAWILAICISFAWFVFAMVVAVTSTSVRLTIGIHLSRELDLSMLVRAAAVHIICCKSNNSKIRTIRRACWTENVEIYFVASLQRRKLTIYLHTLLHVINETTVCTKFAKSKKKKKETHYCI